MADGLELILDDRSSDTCQASNGDSWRVVTDAVMGGLSDAQLHSDRIEGRACLRLKGTVSRRNNGGFVQASLNLDKQGRLDARGYAGVAIEIYGNDENYNLHLRSDDTRIVWQSYRASFQARPRWHSLRLPFAAVEPHRIEQVLDLGSLRRLGVVAIGREMPVDVSIARLSFYP